MKLCLSLVASMLIAGCAGATVRAEAPRQEADPAAIDVDAAVSNHPFLAMAKLHDLLRTLDDLPHDTDAPFRRALLTRGLFDVLASAELPCRATLETMTRGADDENARPRIDKCRAGEPARER